MRSIVALIVAFGLIAGALSASIQLTGTIRDFTPSTNADFEYNGGFQTGMVNFQLDQDGKPTLTSNHPSIHSDATFAQWYRDTANVNIPISYTITLDETAPGSGIFSYTNNNFFPIDGQGFGNYGNYGKNFHFTSEWRSTFTYVGGEVFSFTGDDDVWVFVNNRLAVDLGGIHGPMSGSVNLDQAAATLGLTVGNDYSFAVFQAERHTVGSNFKIETSIQLVSTDPEDPEVVGRDAYICEVYFPNFCPGTPVPTPQQPSRQDDCPSDPSIVLDGQTYSFDDFNAVSFDSFFSNSGDVEGRTAVRNNVNTQAYSHGYETRSGGVSAWDRSLPYALVVGGDLKMIGGSVHPDGSGHPYPGDRENIFVGGSSAQSSSYITEQSVTGHCATEGCLNAYFDNAQAYYTLLSDSWAAVADNVQYVIQYGGVKLTCNDPSSISYQVTIPDVDFNKITYYDIVGCGPDAQFIINVAGTGDVSFSGDNIKRNKNERVLYNIVGAQRNVRVYTEVGGSILAPNNNYIQTGGVVKGLVIAGNMVNVLQINRLHCERPAPPPQPTEEVCPEWETNCAGLNFPLAGQVGSFRDFNVISFGSFVANTGDVEGRLAAKNDVTFGSGYSVGYELQTAGNTPDNSLPYSLVAGRNCVWGQGSLHPDGSGIPYAGEKEDGFCGSSFNGDSELSKRITGNCGGKPGCLNSYFDAAHTCYQGFQNTLSGLSDNVKKEIKWSALTLTCNDDEAERYVVSLTPEEMSQYTYTVTNNCNFHASWVINVRGTSDVFIRGDSFPAICGGVVYNVVGSGRVIDVTETKVCGHLLAPDNTLYQTGGVIVGKVVAGDITMSLQINKQNNCPNPGIITVSSIVTQPSQNNIVTVNSDNLSQGDVVENNGKSYVVEQAIVKQDGTFQLQLNGNVNVEAGSRLSAKVAGGVGRTPMTQESSASVVTFAVALFAILALLI